MHNNNTKYFIMKLATLKSAVIALCTSALTLTLNAQEAGSIRIGAHRGFWDCDEAEHTENSIASLKAAQDHGFWGSEFDVHLTSDNEIVVHHDAHIEGQDIQKNTYSFLKQFKLANGESMPTLDEYLAQAENCPSTVLVLEFKTQYSKEHEDQLVNLAFKKLKEHGLYDPSRVMFISFSMNICKKVAAEAPEFTNQYLNGDIAPADLHKDGINGIDYSYKAIYKHPEWVKEAHDLGMSVNVWTVNKENDMKAMIALGVDCITTNKPLEVRNLLGSEELRLAKPSTDDPKADPKAEVVFGNARFTVLGSRLIRMEWSEDGRFEDRATLGIVNRKLPVPQYTVKKAGKKLTIKTADLTLTYTGDAKFDQNNLHVTFTMPEHTSKNGVRKVSWHPGMDDSGNLLGTVRTLDGCDGVKTKEPYDKGVVSRDGWAVIDESGRQVFVPEDTDWKNWVANRENGDRQDMYMFAYGHDYKAAVKDYIKIGGQIPLPPKYAFGYWWCRFWQYSDFEFVGLGKEIRSLSIPIDVMVLDMDWHETWSLRRKNAPKDEYGQRIGWTGYTWQRKLFPNPANCLQDLHNLGLKTTLNLHPASGIQPYEEPYDKFVKDYLSRTSDYDGPKGYVNADGTKAPVPFRIDDENWANAYFNSVIRPFEKQGVDFWWLDWQQWIDSKYTPGLSNTFWLNYTFFNDMVRQSESQGIYAKRPMIYHRWGGLGSHRYQIGFSGDCQASWKVLGYLPYFTSTASNVGYGYWGHDIGGHLQPKGVTETDPELYTRWLQSGVFTPIFKTHSTKDLTMEKRFWVFPDHFDAMREAVRLRYDLSPYIYNAARQTYDTGISMCRPMYYDYAEDDEAYSWKEEYMFGDDILATTVCSPVDKTTGLAKRGMWFPEGNDWYDMATGTLIKGGQKDTLTYTINENPYYIKAGAIIPMAGAEIKSLQEKSNELRFLIVPGDGKSSASVYEDDGTSQAYKEEFATTEVTKEADASHVTVTVAARQGTYDGISPDRRLQFIFAGVFAPEKVLVNGVEIPYSRFAEHDAQVSGKEAEWGYNGADLSAVVYLPVSDASKEITVECRFNDYAASHRDLLNGKKALMHRMMDITPETKLMFGKYIDAYMMLPDSFLALAQCSSFIKEDPQNAGKYLEAINTKALIDEFSSTEKLPSDFVAKIKAQVNVR